MNTVTQPTLAEAFIDAWQLVMVDPEIPDEIKSRLACAFVGVPEMALQQGHFIGNWPHPVPKKTAPPTLGQRERALNTQ